MNEILKILKTRRSVRSYKDDPVPKDVIETLIDAGNWAPTGANFQAWRFVVVTDPEFRQKLLEAARPHYRKCVEGFRSAKDHWREHIHGPLARSMGLPEEDYDAVIDRLLALHDGVYYEAPVFIFVIGTTAINDDMGCAMVCQNIMLAAHSLGLGSCWVGFGSFIRHAPDIVEALELQDKEKIFGPIIVGYSKIFPDPPPKNPPMVKWI